MSELVHPAFPGGHFPLEEKGNAKSPVKHEVPSTARSIGMTHIWQEFLGCWKVQSTRNEGARSQQNDGKGSPGAEIFGAGRAQSSAFTSILNGFGVFVWAAHPSAPQKCFCHPYSWNWEMDGTLEGFPLWADGGRSRMRAGVCIFPAKRGCCPVPGSIPPGQDLQQLLGELQPRGAGSESSQISEKGAGGWRGLALAEQPGNSLCQPLSLSERLLGCVP